MSFDDAQLRQLAHIAQRVLDEATPSFEQGLGAPVEVRKSPDDYATLADLALERQITRALVEQTGLGVHGEEFGGVDLTTPDPVWVLDPIDGTANYLHQIPLTGINLGLIAGGEALIGLTWLPLLGEKYCAIAGSPPLRNGVVLPKLASARLSDVTVGVGTLKHAEGSAYPASYRMALLSALIEKAFRVRVVGSSAVDLAWVASGRFGACINFGVHVWDNAPGLCLVKAAGGEVTTVSGKPYRLFDDSIVAAAPGVAKECRAVLDAVRDVH